MNLASATPHPPAGWLSSLWAQDGLTDPRQRSSTPLFGGMESRSLKIVTSCFVSLDFYVVPFSHHHHHHALVSHHHHQHQHHHHTLVSHHHHHHHQTLACDHHHHRHHHHPHHHHTLACDHHNHHHHRHHHHTIPQLVTIITTTIPYLSPT